MPTAERNLRARKADCWQNPTDHGALVPRKERKRNGGTAGGPKRLTGRSHIVRSLPRKSEGGTPPPAPTCTDKGTGDLVVTRGRRSLLCGTFANVRLVEYYRRRRCRQANHSTQHFPETCCSDQPSNHAYTRLARNLERRTMRKCERNVLPFGRPWYRNQENKKSSGPFVLGKT